LDESWVAADTAVLRRQALMSDRSYDDEDAQLQAALAASIQDAEGGSSSVPTTADWISEEDSKAIREAQMASWTSMTRQDSEKGPTPADVEKIARMRAEAKQRAEDERLGITRDEAPESSEKSKSAGKGDNKGGGNDEDSDDSDEEESAPQMSPEEMRRARLARFGA
jgi:ataxin-3